MHIYLTETDVALNLTDFDAFCIFEFPIYLYMYLFVNGFLYHIYKWYIVLYSIEFNIKEIQSVYTAYTILSLLSLFWPFKCITE